MAITKEQLDGFKPEGFDDEQWGKVSAGFLALHENDVSGLVKNEGLLKAEKVAEIEKRKLLEDEKNAWLEKEKTLTANLDQLNEKIKSGANNAEQIELAFQQKEKTLTESFATQKTTLEKEIEGLKGKLGVLEKSAFENECKDAFSKAIIGKNLDVDNLEAFKTLALGENFSKFTKKDIGEGKHIITRDDGKDIAASVDEFISSPAGKLFVLNGNSGGGADGGKETPPDTTMKSADFMRLSPSDQAKAALKYTIVD